MTTATEPTADVQGEAKPSFADQLRKLADWLDEHDCPREAVMFAAVEGSYGDEPRPSIKFFSRGERFFRDTFAGCKATEHCEPHSPRHIELTKDGIRFVCWLPRTPDEATERTVAL